MRGGIIRNLREMGALAGDLMQVRYPRFVYGGSQDAAEIAVFTFHSLEPRAFESLLQFLSLGGYGSLKASEVAAIVTGRRPPPTLSRRVEQHVPALQPNPAGFHPSDLIHPRTGR